MIAIRRVAVLGAGTMGARIAAHFANAGTPALVLDVTTDATQRGLTAAQKGKPPAFFADCARDLIAIGDFEADLARIGECDWVIEAVTENLEVKRALWKRVAEVRRPGTIASTNTSGIPLASLSEGFPEDLLQHFLGTHFFNPPRYLHLLELIPGPRTLPPVLEAVDEFAERRLGKGVVRCKDTPNFIANRIGSFLGATVQKLTVKEDFTIEEVDGLTGPLIGMPKSASYRLLDLVGLDVWDHVTRNLQAAAQDDPFHARFVTQPFLSQMIERGWLGDKSGQGCYKRVGSEFYPIDWKTLEYLPPKRPRWAQAEAARNVESLPERLRMLLASGDREGRFLWQLLSDHVLYAAWMTPAISDRIVEIDRAMRWGYNHALGPFELWDALGFRAALARMEAEGRAMPESIQRMADSGAESFYRPGQYFELVSSEYRDLEARPGITALRGCREVRRRAGASLLDLGDGVLCVEFHSKMNAMGEDAVLALEAGLAETERNFAATLIANEGEHFSAGANLLMVLMAAQDGEWDELDLSIRRFQNMNGAIRHALKPVVAAPFGMTLGGGCEVVLHAARVQASAELYMGLVETGVGLIPAGGGCQEMLARGADARTLFDSIGLAKTSGSAEEAISMGLLRPSDSVSINPERLIADAKAAALALAPHYLPPAPAGIAVSGETGYASMKLASYLARQGEFISEYDFFIAEKLAFILSGGRGPSREVPAQHILDLEREAFLSLCGRRETQERIAHMLKTGKPLRN